MFEDFLNHRCNIYHPVDDAVNTGYGINAEPVKVRLTEPDLEDVPCHFHIDPNITVDQKEPYAALSGSVKLTLPYGTDIRENDYIRSRTYVFRAGVPRAVHGNHHIVVTITREEGIKGAI